jgi:hypothetical protein
MATKIYEVAASIAGTCVDGRDFSGVWGHEKQYHPSRESAERACERLRNGGYWGCSDPPTYWIEELTRAQFSPDAIGEQEWRRACRQAGVDPATGEAPSASRIGKAH